MRCINLKTYHCPYCNLKLNRQKLIDHIEKEHDAQLPVNYTAYRMVYDIVNNKPGYGRCCCCNKPTTWNEKRQKYNRLCGDPKCYEEVRKTYESRMLRVYNKTSLLDEPAMQEKMLAHRKISGKYKWSDGREFTYTGSYEKNLMEFLDKTLEYKSNEIVAPGPVLEYEYKGKKLHWITDFLIIPYNLIIEVKDGGDNPNNRVMTEYREKQVAKEKMITNAGTFNYIRLTNNNFAQLLSILAELKKKTLEDNNNPIYRIHEDVNMEPDYLFEQLYTVTADITEEVKGFLYDHPGIRVVTEDYIDRLVDNPLTEEEMMECISIIPIFKNKNIENRFRNLLENCLKDLNKDYNDEIAYYYHNPNNILNGCTIGIKTSE